MAIKQLGLDYDSESEKYSSNLSEKKLAIDNLDKNRLNCIKEGCEEMNKLEVLKHLKELDSNKNTLIDLKKRHIKELENILERAKLYQITKEIFKTKNKEIEELNEEIIKLNDELAKYKEDVTPFSNSHKKELDKLRGEELSDNKNLDDYRTKLTKFSESRGLLFNAVINPKKEDNLDDLDKKSKEELANFDTLTDILKKINNKDSAFYYAVTEIENAKFTFEYTIK